MNVDPKTISDTRNQLHWASQLLSAAADAKLDKADDDSHSNLGWDAAKNSLVGRAGCSIEVNEFKLLHADDSFPLTGQTLAAAKDWLAGSLGCDLAFRDYEMPEHAVSKDSSFSPDRAHLESISEWFSFAEKSLDGHGTLRIWPHHFDMGFWVPGDADGRSIGGGFSLGDHYYDRPYFYINPYGVERPDSLAALPAGHWTEHWFGAVLAAEEMGAESRSEAAKSYIAAALDACKKLIS